MLLYLLSYLAGALTIMSPCILPILPFAFARAGKPFLSHGLPMLAGMTVMFAGMAVLVSVGGQWAVGANDVGRGVALVLLALFGLTLVFPSLADRMTRPLVQLGGRWAENAHGDSGWRGSLALGAATGLLWAPCAGPILGLVLTGAALKGGGLATGALLLAYGLGAATSLALALVVGGKVYGAMKRSLGFGERVRQVLGLVVLGAVAVIALGLDTGVLTKLSAASTNRIEQGLLERFGIARKAASSGDGLGDEGANPGFNGATLWLNGQPLTAADLKGKVVLVDFWTYSCINCLRTLPYVKGWAEKYRQAGLVVVGVHTPEFAFEKDPTNVRDAVKRLGVTYPVALDNNYAIWKAFNNEYWPAEYLIDAQGRIRAHMFGEGDDAAFEKLIQKVLAENGASAVPGGTVQGMDQGIEAERSGQEQSPETYVGYARSQGFSSTPAVKQDAAETYALGGLQSDGWGLEGRWTVGAESARLETAGGGIAYRFQARDLHLVLGPAAGGKLVRFRVTIDGHAPGADHGVDTDAQGNGVVTDNRLYQLVRLAKGAGDHSFMITFLDPGVEAFAFTFG
ncbi:cytochrome c biogenesis protein DipZ [Novosphingobium terrae]|uniref:cytochrome c biogenesis protein DipZ n=1 Tax=Novosphingobium terrae TaxID=2726189 RepID=UPI00197F9F9A|nr:cytochrome c biogenesis protein DipZ [Novosphingobium terrae]